MKEIMIIERPINNINDDDYIHIYHFARKEYLKYKIEKYPTSWGELKELCKKLKEEDILVMNDCIVFRDLNFDKSGMICVPTNGYFAISIGRTPQQMWGIIKNLIGE